MGIVLPVEFTNRMREQLGAEMDAFLKAYDESNYHGLRLNVLKSKGRTVADKFALRPVPWCGTGFYYDEEQRPGRHPYHHAGAYYIQEPSAMLVGELAAPTPGMKVLDLCAAPGGKTSHLAGFLNGEGVLVANEIVPNRARILSQNVEGMGTRNCIVTNESPDRLEPYFSSYFDLIVVDAPCSGEGMFRRDEIARTEWSLDNVKACVERGEGILESADRMLKVGGKLVYSTCTFAPDEDEMAISTFLKAHPVYHIEKTDVTKSDGADDSDGWISEGRPEWSDGNEDLKSTYRLWPHKLHGEGHYVAVLRKGDTDCYEAADETVVKRDKRASKAKNDTASQALKKAVDLYEEFSRGIFANINGEYVMFGDNLYMYPEGAPAAGRLRVERAGLHLGEIKKDRFEPAHALAMALNPDEYKNVIELDEDTALKYLCGETVSCDMGLKGWQLITVDGYSIGWGKAASGILKNHYPKGLRIKR